jgi:hypothetical protein
MVVLPGAHAIPHNASSSKIVDHKPQQVWTLDQLHRLLELRPPNVGHLVTMPRSRNTLTIDARLEGLTHEPVEEPLR